MQGVKHRLDSVYRKLRTGQYKSPQMLKDDFSDARRLLSQYKEGESLLLQIEQIISAVQLSPEREQYWFRRLNFIETELQSPNQDAASFQTWKSTVEETRTALEADIAQRFATKSTRSRAEYITENSVENTANISS